MSVDFSESIKLIREAHSDSVAILEKWRELLELSGELVLNVKGENGQVVPHTVPTIKEAIDRYLGGTFSRITLTDGTNSVILRLNPNGALELVNTDNSPANMIAMTIAANTIRGAQGDVRLEGNVYLQGGSVQNMELQEVSVGSARIYNAQFNGPLTVGGGAEIHDAAIHNATVGDLEAGLVRYHKQVLRWSRVGTITNDLIGLSNDGLWEGPVAALTAAGIEATPTWSDCIYAPTWGAGATIKVFWGETGDTEVLNAQGQSGISSLFAAMWPYKMYEKVGLLYRIRWLPFDGMEGRITYYRTQNVPVYYSIQVRRTEQGGVTPVRTMVQRQQTRYVCQRAMAEVEQIANGTDYRLYMM